MTWTTAPLSKAKSNRCLQQNEHKLRSFIELETSQQGVGSAMLSCGKIYLIDSKQSDW